MPTLFGKLFKRQSSDNTELMEQKAKLIISGARSSLVAKDYDGAIESCSKAIGIAPNHFDAYFVKAFAHNKKGEFDEAIASFEKAVQCDRATDAEKASAYYNIYIACSTKGDVENAKDAASNVLKIDSNHQLALLGLGQCYKEEGNYELALKQFDKLTLVGKVDPAIAKAMEAVVNTIRLTAKLAEKNPSDYIPKEVEAKYPSTSKELHDNDSGHEGDSSDDYSDNDSNHSDETPTMTLVLTGENGGMFSNADNADC